ncbi:hypothetical protein LCGC14_2331370, partial [marine sediment metagenome]
MEQKNKMKNSPRAKRHKILKRKVR